MQRSLLLLSRLQFYAGWRRFKRAIASPKGIVVALVLVAFLGLVLAPNFLPLRGDRPSPMPSNWLVHPATLCGVFLLTAAGGRMKSPISFSLAEVEFLFPGPFTRRELLVHKLLTSAFGTLGFALLTPLLAAPYLTVWWPAALVGIWLVATFMQFTAILIALASDWLATRLRNWWAVAVSALAIAIVVSFWQAGVVDAGLDFRERLSAVESSWIARAVLAPFVVFTNLICAQSTADLAVWGSASLAMTCAVAAAIMRLDGNFLEASLVASQRRYDLMQRAIRGGGVPSIGTRTKPRFTLPSFPRAGGAGPIAWQQMLQLIRGSGRLLFILPALAGPMIGLLIAKETPAQQQPFTMVVTMTLLVGYIVSTIMPLGLRTDLDHVDAIKSLPIRSTSIVAGSLVAAMAYIAAIQLVTNLAHAVVLQGWTLANTLAMAFALPLDLLLVASDSVLVLLFPSVRRFVPGDILVGVRIMLVNLAKMAFAFAAAGIAGLGVALVWVVAGESLPAMAAAGWITLAIEGAATIGVAAVLFARYDPSTDAARGE